MSSHQSSFFTIFLTLARYFPVLPLRRPVTAHVLGLTLIAGMCAAATSPIVTWSPGGITYGTTLGGSSLNATASVPGTFSYSPSAGTLLSAGTQTLSVSFTPTDTVNYTTVTGVTRSITVAKRGISVTGLAAVSREYNGTSSVTITGTPALNIASIVSGDSGSLSLSGTPSGSVGNKSAGSFKSVTVSGLSLSGSASSNYSLTPPSTLTATIYQRFAALSGVSLNPKIYDGKTDVGVNVSGVSIGNIISGDSVSLSVGSISARFDNPNAGTGKQVFVTGLGLSGIDAANYTTGGSIPLTGTIQQAPVTIIFSNNIHPYDGGPKTATITAIPQAALNVNYSNTPGTDFPRNAGTYNINVVVTDPNHTGNGIGTLTITKAVQDLRFSFSGTDTGIGSLFRLNATVSTGFPITYSLVAGTATLSADSLILTQPGTVTVRATQAGTDNYEPAIAEQTISARLAQSIRFAPPANRKVTDPSFDVAASATSGLPVSFSIGSGPATLSGNRVSLTGTAGRVLIRASQGGNETYAPAPDQTWVFAVSGVIPDTFFGDLVDAPESVDAERALTTATSDLAAKSGDIAAAYDLGTRRGTVLLVAPSLGVNVSLDFEITTDDGAYSIPFTAAGRSLTLTGNVTGTAITGRISALHVAFSAPLQARTGSTAALAGVYQSSTVNSATGGATSIVGPNGQIVLIASSSGSTTGATGAIAANGTFTVSTSAVTVAGAIDASTNGLSGTLTAPNQASVAIAGLAATATRTDRVVNLSSRVRIAPTAGRTLVTGFVIGGMEPKRVLLRGVGPALTGFGVAGALVNPHLQVFDAAGKVILENDDWSGPETAAAFTQTGAFALTAGSKDAALLATLPPGAYTMQVTASGETGIGLAEIYDASSAPGAESQRLINLSSRGLVEPGGDGLLVGGFVVTGNSPKKVLIRGIGPALGTFGVPGTLADPRLAIYSGATLVAQNDDWFTPSPVDSRQTAASASEISTAATSVGAFALGGGGKDAAILITLAPGAYTAQVAGSTSGVALVEIYEVP
jgi:hypothetical protein